MRSPARKYLRRVFAFSKTLLTIFSPARLTQLGLKNRDGIDIKEYWHEGIRTYLGMFFHGFPNAFMLFTPQGML